MTVVISKNHHRNLAVSCLVSEIVFNEEFSHLCEELVIIYRKYNVNNPEQEAYNDSLYCCLTQKESGIKAFSY